MTPRNHNADTYKVFPAWAVNENDPEKSESFHYAAWVKFHGTEYEQYLEKKDV